MNPEAAFSLPPPNTPNTFSLISSKLSEKLLTAFLNPWNAANAPPPTIPASKFLTVRLLRIHSTTGDKKFLSHPNTPPIACPVAVTPCFTPPILPINESITPDTVLSTLVMVSCKYWNAPLDLTFLLRSMKNCPIDAVISKNLLPTFFSRLPPKNSAKGFKSCPRPYLTKSNAANKPRNVVLILPIASSLGFRLAVNCLNLTVRLYSCSPVVAGKNSLKLSLKAVIT